MHPPLWEDTSPAAEQVLVAAYRRMTSAQKARQIDALTCGIQQLALARIRSEFPQESERAQQLRLAALWIEPELLEKMTAYQTKLKGK